MKILIELPTWLGDTIMATPAIENLYNSYPNAKITILGSFVSTQVLKAHPRVDRVVIDKTKSRGIRLLNVIKLSKELETYDLAISFRSHFYSKLLLMLTKSKRRYIYKSPKNSIHQVEKYSNFIDNVVGKNLTPSKLRLDYRAISYTKPTLGINPGASYGSAKRWYPDKFAKVALSLSDKYEIIIFGGSNEIDIAKDIESSLQAQGVRNVQNLAGKTTIEELCSAIGGLNLFITGDSGPMHIATAYQIPTIAIFGPTKWKETSPWKNPKSKIVRHNLECSPCMKRTCPLKHHECMRGIEANEVLEAIKKL